MTSGDNEVSNGVATKKTYKDIELSDTSSDEGVSSDADSDFIDVPEIENEDAVVDLLVKSKEPLPMPFLMNVPPLPDASKDFRHHDLQRKEVKFQVVVKPQPQHDEEDIFADIFSKPESVSTEPIKQTDAVLIVSDDDDANETPPSTVLPVVNEPILVASKRISSILNDLDKEILAATKLNINDILQPSTAGDKVQIDEVVKTSPVQVEIGGNIESNNSNEPVTPTKIVQPFFVRKTPPSSTKKSDQPPDSPHKMPNKASTSLMDTFESRPISSNSTHSVHVSPPNAQQTFDMAANLLREKKSEAELKQIAAQISQDKLDLVAERNKKDRMGVSITEQMSAECMDLLRLFGIPYIVAPMEAEAQCAFLNEIHLTDGTITDDSDIWLFGGQTVYKNFFDQNKLVMEFKLASIKKLVPFGAQRIDSVVDVGRQRLHAGHSWHWHGDCIGSALVVQRNTNEGWRNHSHHVHHVRIAKI